MSQREAIMREIPWVPQRVILHALIGYSGVLLCPGIGTQTLEGIFRNCSPKYPFAAVELTIGNDIAIIDLTYNAWMDDEGLHIRPPYIVVFPDVDTAIATTVMQIHAITKD
jgi:hypothetical protein